MPDARDSETIRRVVCILKDATIFVKLLPFINAALLLLCHVCYYVCDSDNTLSLIDTFCYVSPIYCLSLLILSKLLRFCIWHKIQCFLPVLPVIIQFADDYVYTAGEFSAYVDYLCVIAIIVLSMFNAIKIFLCNQQKQ
jgi:hypothetical protein